MRTLRLTGNLPKSFKAVHKPASCSGIPETWTHLFAKLPTSEFDLPSLSFLISEMGTITLPSSSDLKG